MSRNPYDYTDVPIKAFGLIIAIAVLTGLVLRKSDPKFRKPVATNDLGTTMVVTPKITTSTWIIPPWAKTVQVVYATGGGGGGPGSTKPQATNQMVYVADGAVNTTIQAAISTN